MITMYRFQVEFLNQQVQDLKGKLTAQINAQEKISDLRQLVLHLEDRLTQMSLKESAKSLESSDYHHLEAAPISYVQYPLNDQGLHRYNSLCTYISKHLF